MDTYLVSYLKNGELYETTTKATTLDEARGKIATRFDILPKFEIDTIYTDEDNHVGAVIQI